jgi:hypothetical protein
MAIGLKLRRANTMEGMLQNLGVAQLMNSDIPKKVCFPADGNSDRGGNHKPAAAGGRPLDN